MKTLQDKLNEAEARKAEGNWQIDCGGAEKPLKAKSGRRLQDMWQPATGNHHYLDLGTDIFLTGEEALRELANDAF